LHGGEIRGSGAKDLTWYRPDGREMTDDDWGNTEVHSLGLQLVGDAIDDVEAEGNPIIDDTLLMLLNAHHEPLSFVLPDHGAGTQWELILDTRESTGKRQSPLIPGGKPYELEARSRVLLRLPGNKGSARSY
jgi:isoamylase